MKGNQFITIAAVVVAAASLSYAAGTRATQATSNTSSPVLVTNNTAQCVPASIYHSITLPVREVNGDGNTLWERQVSFHLYDNTNFGEWDYTVPAGYTLLLRDIGGTSGNVSGAPANTLKITAKNGSNPYDVIWNTQFDKIPDSTDTCTINKQMFLVIPGGDTLAVQAYTQVSESSQGYAVTTLSGELIPKY